MLFELVAAEHNQLERVVMPRMVSTNLRPNEPVPPVTSTTFVDQSKIGSSYSIKATTRHFMVLQLSTSWPGDGPFSEIMRR